MTSEHVNAVMLDFASSLQATAEACTNDYFEHVKDWTDDTPALLWEEAWTALVGGITEGTANLSKSLGLDPLTSQAVTEAALGFCFARFDVVNNAIIERNGRRVN